MEAYAGSEATPKIETTDNVFKIILPNLNAHTQKGESAKEKRKAIADEETVIALARKQGSFTRKEIEEKLGISQTTCGRLIRRMVEEGQITQEGKGKNSHYALPE